MAPTKKAMTRKEYERLLKAKEDEERVRQNRLRLEKEKALERWVEEFLLPADEFTMQAYNEFLLDPENMEEAQERREERDKLVEKYFGNALLEKEDKARRSITLGKVVRAANRLWQDAKKEMYKAGMDALSLLEPYEKKVERRVTESLKRIVATDKETEEFLYKRQHALDVLDQQAKQAKADSRKRKMQLEVHEFVTDIVKRDEDKVKQEQRRKRTEQFKAQVRAGAEARLQARKDAKEAKKKQEADGLLKIRRWRLRHWSKVAVEAATEAQELKQAQLRAAEERVEEAVTRDQEEDEERRLDWTEEQVAAPATSSDTVLPSGKRLGVFGLPLGEGEFLGYQGGGHKAGVDDPEVQLFQPTHQHQYEKKDWPVWEAQAQEERKRLLYTQLQSEAKALGEQAGLLDETKRRLLVDLRQLRQEEALLVSTVGQPPQRYFDAAEKEEMHARQLRLKALQRQIESVDKQAAEAAEKRKDMEAQATGLAKELAVLAERNKAMAAERQAQSGGELPVVVGRHISKIPEIGEFRGRPKESYQLVVQQSKLEVFKEQSKAVFKAQREGRALGMKVWVTSEEKRMNREVMEELLSRLKDAQERVKVQVGENAKQDLLMALQLFFSSRERLLRVDREQAGGVPWWLHRSEKDCHHVEQVWSSEEAREDVARGLMSETSRVDVSDPEFASKRNRDPARQGVSLAGGSRRGVVMGKFDFPKLDLWTVQLIVAKREPSLADQGPASDYVSIRLGPSVKSMTAVGRYFNVVNEDTLSIRYEVTYQLKARSLAYRFEFQSDTDDADKHMTVLPAVYANKPLEELEELGGNRVLSALVKYMRAEASKGSMRNERLLEELVSAEASPDRPFWDTDVLIGYSQRYLTADFIAKAGNELRKLSEAEAQKRHKPMLANRELTKLTGSERRDLRSLRSRNNYVKRKRLQHQETVDAARVLKGRHLMVYQEEARAWEHVRVLDVRVKWRDQVEPQVTFIVQAFNEWGEPQGDAHVRDLSACRFHELEEEPERDEDAYRQFCEQREKQAQLEAEQKKNEERRRAEQELSDKLKQEGMHELARRRQLRLEDAAKQIEAEADRRLKDEAFVEKLEVFVLAVMEEMKQGLFKDKHGNAYAKPNEADAKVEAYRRWKADYIAKTLAKTEDELLYQEAVQREKMEHRLRKMERRRRRKEEKQARQVAALAAEQERLRNQRLKELAQMRMAMLRQALVIPHFHLAVAGGPDWPFCEHIKAKAWGSLYGKGLRCQRCSKELTTTYDDPSQQQGIGYGEDPELVGLVARHRLNSPAFRARSSEELRRVEEERRRLEKERREMKECESMFYDLEDMKAIYEFDRRHQTFFKQEGVFRQGVQWSERETTAWKRRVEEELEALTPRTRAKRRREFDDALYERRPAPTLRHYDVVRRALHQDLLQSFGRVNNCRMRITELKAMRVTILTRRKEAGAQVEYVHEKMVALEQRLHRLETTLDETDGLLRRRERADKAWQNAKALVVAAESDQKETELACVGLDDLVREASQLLSLRSSEVEVLLRQKIIMEREAKRLRLNIKDLHERSRQLRHEMEEEEDRVATLQYCKKGNLVPTPYGCTGRVWYHREEDDMVLLHLRFGKVYMLPYRSVLLDRARQQAARVEMEVEEQMCRAFYKYEDELRKREEVGMREEDERARLLAKEEREEAQHRWLVEQSVRDEEAEVRAALQTPEGMAAINEKADRAVAEAAAKRLQERRTHKGGKKDRPQPMSSKEKEELRARTAAKLQADLLANRLLMRRQLTTSTLEAQRRERAELEALNSTFQGLMHDLIVSVADEELHLALETKTRSQAESGIVFLDPPHMTYGIYKALRYRWVERRQYLRNSIDLLMSKASKSREEFQAEAAKARRLNESLEARERREGEEKRQAELNAQMAAEEAALRNFYREEFLANLRERRLMQQEERYMRMYLLMLQKVEEMRRAEAAGEVPQGLSRNELRRLELKKSAASKIREEKEGLQMMQEDEAAFELRAYYKMLEQREKLLAEGGMVKVDDDSDDDSEDDESVQLDEQEDAEVIPNIPPKLTEWTDAEQDELLKAGKSVADLETAKKERVKQIRKRRRRVRIMVETNRRRKAAERSAAAKWNMLHETSMVKCMKAELAWMEAEEEDRVMEFDLRSLEESLRKLNGLAQRKGIEEVRARQEHRTRTEHRDACVTARDEATQWAAKCREHEQKRRRIRTRVLEDTRFRDTDVVMGFYQRWRPEDLSRRLYWDYFRTLAVILATRCEVVALERRLLKMQDYLVRNWQELREKQAMLKSLGAGLRRRVMRRWRRSELGSRLFTKSRRHVLTRFFQGWVRYLLWQQGFQKAFQLKYTLVKHELDLRRLYPETRAAAERAEHGTTTTDDDDEKAGGGGKPEDGRGSRGLGAGAAAGGGGADSVKRTLLMRHKMRPLRCRNCRAFYIEDQNQGTACAFHPGEYKIACPRSCPGLSMKCMSHRMKRWTCCDNREESQHMRNGCRSRRHMAVPDAAPYDAMEEATKAAYASRDQQLTQELEALEKEDWPRQLLANARQQLKAVEEDLVQQRAAVHKFDDMSFD